MVAAGGIGKFFEVVEVVLLTDRLAELDNMADVGRTPELVKMKVDVPGENAELLAITELL